MARRRSRLIAVTLVLCTAVSVAYGDFTVTTNPSSAGSGSMGTQMRTVVSLRNTAPDAVTATIMQTSAPDCTGLTLTDTNGMTSTQWPFAAGEQRQFVIKPMMPYTTTGVRTCTWIATPLGLPPTSWSSVFNVINSGAETWNVQPAAFDFTVSGANETQVAYVQNYSTAPITYTNMSIDDGGLNVMSIEGGTCNGMKSCPGVTIMPGSFQTIGIKCTPPLTGQVTGTITYMMGASGGAPKVQNFVCKRSGAPPVINIMQTQLTMQGPAGVEASAPATITASGPDSLQQATIIGTDANAFRLVMPAPPCTGGTTCMWTPAQPIGASFTVVVECTPGMTQKTAKLRVKGTAHANDFDEADLSCVADSGASAGPSLLDFGEVKVTTTSAPKQVTITNLSASQPVSITVDTGHPDWLVSDCTSPCTIGPSGTKVIDVRFKPAMPAQNDRTLGVFVGGMQVASVMLRGNGTGSRLRVTNQTAPYVIDFGTIGLGTLRTRDVALEADGNRSINVAIGAPASPFSVTANALDLAAGAGGLFGIRCQSSTPGMFSGMVPLTPGPEDHVYAADTPKLDVRCRVANTPVQVSPDELDFGEVRKNAPAPSIEIDITNPSAAPISLDYVQLTDDTALALSMANDDVLDPGETVTVTLELATTIELTIDSSLEVGVGGEQLVTPITGKVVTASARVTPTELRLGSVCVGTVVDEPVKLVNSGTAILHAQPPMMNDPFAISFVSPVNYPEGGALLSPLEEATATVRLSTQTAGRVMGKLMWDVDAPEAPFVIDASVEVKQDGTAVSPQAIGFDQVRAGERSERRSVRLENCGDAPTAIQVLGITSMRGGADAWELLPPKLQTMLEPGEKRTLEVFFAPRHAGPHIATIQLDVDGQRQEIELTGEALGGATERTSLYACSCTTGGPQSIAFALVLLLVICRRRTGSS